MFVHRCMYSSACINQVPHENAEHHEAVTYSSAGSGAAAAAALSPGGGCSAGTAFEDLAGVDVGDTLFVGEP